MMTVISVIIPVYNTGKYLPECLDSVINQTFKDIEIICINDGSTDNSAEILKEYAKKDKRIKVINQKNAGVVTARNNGISKAKGEYIYPLDSDDVITHDCLQKLHKAITKGKGDIITNRVMYFGEENIEMILPKPNKYNMALGNCFVNAALFRKKDFELTGGYNTKFNTALEDYDLWLNMMFNHNKKVYRINKILFYYRQKPHDEARNYQNRSVHHQLLIDMFKQYPLLIDMFKQYPQIEKYIILSKIIKPLKKISRFFFRIENHKVKIFKHTVYRLRKYDTVISVGSACFIPTALKSIGLRDFSGPFDWMFGSNVENRLKIILNKFANYFNYEDFEYIGKNPDNGKIIYKNIRTGIVYNHDFPDGEFNDVFKSVANTYDRRIKRTLYHLNTDKRILLVYAELGQNGNIYEISEIMEQINKKYKSHIDLLYINHNPKIKLHHYKNIKRLSPYLLYSEYYYKTYPTETEQATKIVKSIVKKIVK